MISYNIPLLVGHEEEYFKNSLAQKKYCGSGPYTLKVEKHLNELLKSRETLLTSSCTHSLELSAMLFNVKPGDEVIMPSFTFVSTALAFVNRGARIFYVDIRPDTLNLDEKLIENAITDRTVGIVPVHYAGVSCEMDKIMEVARKHNLFVVEDAAQGIDCTYKGKSLGSIGHVGAMSFHETKNIQCGEGGALFINDPELINRAEIIREKGTNRKKFFEGQVDKYTWVDIGSSYLMNDFTASFLLSQLEHRKVYYQNRMDIWKRYYNSFKSILPSDIILPTIPEGIVHNAHIFSLITRNNIERKSLLAYLKENQIHCTSHYVPLHSSEYGRKTGAFIGQDKYTTNYSERLIRLPIYCSLENEKQDYVIQKIKDFYKC